MADRHSEGARLFRAEIGRRGLKASAVAAELDLLPSSLHHYTIRETYKPNAGTRLRIETWSEGRVPSPAWDEPASVAAAPEEAAS
jgi:hypothetical protein